MAWLGVLTYQDANGTHSIEVGSPEQSREAAVAVIREMLECFVPGALFLGAELDELGDAAYLLAVHERPRQPRGRHR